MLDTSLSENTIKKVALQFFRQHYRNRLRFEDQPVTARFDLEGVGGIIADGYYSFRKTDGKRFIATFEATSKDSRDEVIYKPQFRILFWDGLAGACLLLFFLTGLNHIFSFQDTSQQSLLFRIAAMLFLMSLFLILFYVVAKNFRRYRYIYAIEQFKKYHADEQWIALAEDALTDADGKYFSELRHQCVFNGFGLLQITKEKEPRILVTPSRQDIFLGKRHPLEFPNQEQEGIQALALQPPGLGSSKLQRFINRDPSILRFRKSYATQMWVSAGSLLLVALIIYRESTLKGTLRVKAEKYRTEVGISKSGGRHENKAVIGDSPIPIETPNMELDSLNRQLWNAEKVIAAQKKQQAPRTNKSTENPKTNDTTAIVINQREGQSLVYDCARFYTFKKPMYLVEEGVYPSWEKARQRLVILKKNNLEAAALMRSCFFPGEQGLVIYLGMIYNSREEASQHIEALAGIKQPVLTHVQRLKILELPPPRTVE